VTSVVVMMVLVVVESTASMWNRLRRFHWEIRRGRISPGNT
jgi:hypothetical protein